MNEKGIILKFPAFFARTNTALVLKEPKTKTSTRKVFLPKTVAEMLKERYQEIQEYKELFGDFALVALVCLMLEALLSLVVFRKLP